MIRRYYDRNTNLFLTLGGSKRAATIHRALWAPGLLSRAEALDTSHNLLAEQARLAAQTGTALHVLDLGCGVGGSLFSLAEKLSPDLSGSGAWRGTGVTISPIQVDLARSEAGRRGFGSEFTFLESDFLALPPLAPVDLAYSIEAFGLTSDPAAYFDSVSRVLRPGGRLVLIDDFLQPRAGATATLNPHEQHEIAQFRAGWHAAGLDTVTAARDRAAKAGLRLVESPELTSWVRVNTWRDRMVALAVVLGRLLHLHGPYWNSLYGGNALRNCIAAGLSGYYCLIFVKSATHE
jgi:cyclopropane fatty-acyl-phospholipid synthase-like methyltransferase